MGTNTQAPTTSQYGPDFMGFWNTNIQSGQADYTNKQQMSYEKQAQLVALMKKWAENYPSFKKKLLEKGFMRADGSLDYSKMLNRDYLQRVDNAWKESTLKQDQAFRTAVNTQAQKQGGVQSLPMMKGVDDMMASERRNAIGEYTDKYQEEYGRAEQRGKELTQMEVADELGKMEAEIRAAGADAGMWKGAVIDAYKFLEQQSPGIFQDFGKLVDVAADVASIVIGVAAAAPTGGASLALPALKLGSKVAGAAIQGNTKRDTSVAEMQGTYPGWEPDKNMAPIANTYGSQGQYDPADYSSTPSAPTPSAPTLNLTPRGQGPAPVSQAPASIAPQATKQRTSLLPEIDFSNLEDPLRQKQNQTGALDMDWLNKVLGYSGMRRLGKTPNQQYYRDIYGKSFGNF
jgi:hypothetical protein